MLGTYCSNTAPSIQFTDEYMLQAQMSHNVEGSGAPWLQEADSTVMCSFPQQLSGGFLWGPLGVRRPTPQ